MKLSSAFSVLAIAIAAVNATIKVTIDDLPSTLTVGQTYEVCYFNQAKAALKLDLVRKGKPGGITAWTEVKHIFAHEIEEGPSHYSYNWTIPPHTPTEGYYALWLDGSALAGEGHGGYADLTNYFRIQHAQSYQA